MYAIKFKTQNAKEAFMDSYREFEISHSTSGRRSALMVAGRGSKRNTRLQSPEDNEDPSELMIISDLSVMINGSAIVDFLSHPVTTGRRGGTVEYYPNASIIDIAEALFRTFEADAVIKLRDAGNIGIGDAKEVEELFENYVNYCINELRRKGLSIYSRVTL